MYSGLNWPGPSENQSPWRSHSHSDSQGLVQGMPAALNSAEQTGRLGAPAGICVTRSRANLSAPEPFTRLEEPTPRTRLACFTQSPLVPMSVTTRDHPHSTLQPHKWAPRPGQVSTTHQAPRRLR